MTNPRAALLFRSVLDAATIIRAADGGRIVVLAPHPDDETIGCGLLIARAARARLPLGVVALTDGQASHPGSQRWPPAALGRLRRGELRRALARLGARNAAVRFAGWTDGRLAATGSALQLRRLLRELNPAVVLVASPRDHHPDHKTGWSLASAAVRGTGVPLVAYAVWSRANDGGNRVRDPARAAKRSALAAHRSQTGDFISDDPAGFRLSSGIQARFVGKPERFEMLIEHQAFR